MISCESHVNENFPRIFKRPSIHTAPTGSTLVSALWHFSSRWRWFPKPKAYLWRASSETLRREASGSFEGGGRQMLRKLVTRPLRRRKRNVCVSIVNYDVIAKIVLLRPRLFGYLFVNTLIPVQIGVPNHPKRDGIHRS